MRVRPGPRLGGQLIEVGETRDLLLPVSQSFSGIDVSIPVRVISSAREGPIVLLTAAVHGDELNGTGVLRNLMMEPSFVLEAGTMILVPVVNILGFERQTRYLPDRRDLNRCFPGIAGGSLASRIAHTIFEELISGCDFCIDLHTAALNRTNFPNVRADLRSPDVARLAHAYGSPLTIDATGAKGTLRREATKAGIPTIILEAGEARKVEPPVIELALRGIRNVLIEYGMIAGANEEPAYRAVIDSTTWLRTDVGGMLLFHAAPGDTVEKGELVARVTSLLGVELGRIESPSAGVIMGQTTLPAVKPGDPVSHLGIPRDGIDPIRDAVRSLSQESLHERMREHLASGIAIVSDFESRFAVKRAVSKPVD